MSNTIRELMSKISKLQETQKKILNHKKLSKLTEQDQLSFCRNNKKIAEFAYEAYIKLNEANHPNQAAKYFNVSYELCSQKAIDEMSTAIKKEAKATIKKSEIKGSAEALFIKGLCYLLGIGKKQNRANAIPFFERAAKLKNAKAQLNLGLMYHNGFGIKEGKEEAVKWYRLAAAQGNALAQYNLGVMYDTGIKEDREEVVKWSRLAAEQGYALAQNNLGVMYNYGLGIKEDKEEAVKWYRCAAEQGLAKAQNNLGWMYKYSDDVEDKEEAVKWFRLAAEQGNARALKDLNDLKETIPEASYHLAMMEADAKEIETLITKTPYLIKALLWDCHRSKDNSTLFNTVLPVINHLLSQPHWVKKAGADASKIMVTFLSSQIERKALSFQQTLILNYLSISSINEKECLKLIQLTSDVWFYSKLYFDGDKYDKFTHQAAELLTHLTHPPLQFS